MVKIVLEGEDAIQYFQNEKIADANYAKIIDINNELMGNYKKVREEYDILLEAYNSLMTDYNELKGSKVSARVKADSEKLTSKNKKVFDHKAPEPEEEITESEEVEYTKDRWSEQEVNQLHDYVNNSAASIRTLKHAKYKLPRRSDAAIRSKLNKMGVSVTKGALVKDSNYQPPQD